MAVESRAYSCSIALSHTVAKLKTCANKKVELRPYASKRGIRSSVTRSGATCSKKPALALASRRRVARARTAGRCGEGIPHSAIAVAEPRGREDRFGRDVLSAE